MSIFTKPNSTPTHTEVEAERKPVSCPARLERLPGNSGEDAVPEGSPPEPKQLETRHSIF